MIQYLMSRIDTPLLKRMFLDFFYQPVFDIPRLPLFMLRSELSSCPLRSMQPLRVTLFGIIIVSPLQRGCCYLRLECTGLYRQLSLLKHIFAQCLPLLPHISRLELEVFENCNLELDERDSMPWLELLHSFNAVQILHISASPPCYFPEIHIARGLGELTRESAAKVLPIMHTLLLNRFDRVGYLVSPLLKPFIDARQLSGQPVEVR